MNRPKWLTVIYIYLILLVVFVVFKFDGSFYSLSQTYDSIKNNRENGNMNYNVHFSRTIRSQIKYFSSDYAYRNLIGNLVIYLPLGFLIPVVLSYSNKTIFAKSLLINLGVILVVEVLQFTLMVGFFDIDDIFLNLCGCILGYLIYTLINRHIYNFRENKFI